MKFSGKTLAGVLAIGLGSLVPMVSADTLQMKDGRVIQGKFLGGTQASVQFQSGGKIDLYNVGDIISVTFTGNPDSVASPSPAPPASAGFQAPPSPLAADNLQTASGPMAGVPPAPTADSTNGITVPAGTEILVRMIDGVDSDKNHVGDRFRASLEQDFVVNGVTIAPKGADVYGRLSEAKEAGHISGKSELKLELTDMLIHNRLQPILTGDYEVSGSSRGSNTAKKVGIGAVAGTVIGALAGGGKGAAIGAGVGAGAGAGVQLVTKGEQVHVPSETLLSFRLDQPFTVSTTGQ